MPIEHLPRRNEQAVRDMSKDLLRRLHSPTSNSGRTPAYRIPPIGQLRWGGTPVLLESDQARVVSIRATHIELSSSVSFPFLNRSPEQEGHSTEIVEPLVGTSILVDEHILKGESQDAGDRPPILRRRADLHVVAQAVH